MLRRPLFSWAALSRGFASSVADSMKFLSLMIPKEAVESGWLDITSAEERTNRTLLTQRIDGNHRILKGMLAHSRPQSIRTTMNYLFEGRAISGIFELGDSALPSSV